MVSPFPVRVPVVLERHRTGAVDDLGNPENAWSEPETVNIIGVEPATSSEPLTTGPNRIVVDAQAHVPVSLDLKPKDRITVAGHRFEVVGFPGRADLGPWVDWPVATVGLKAVEG